MLLNYEKKNVRFHISLAGIANSGLKLLLCFFPQRKEEYLKLTIFPKGRCYHAISNMVLIDAEKWTIFYHLNLIPGITENRKDKILPSPEH
jgi:hypothetical protein